MGGRRCEREKSNHFPSGFCRSFSENDMAADSQELGMVEESPSHSALFPRRQGVLWTCIYMYVCIHMKKFSVQ